MQSQIDTPHQDKEMHDGKIHRFQESLQTLVVPKDKISNDFAFKFAMIENEINSSQDKLDMMTKEAGPKFNDMQTDVGRTTEAKSVEMFDSLLDVKNKSRRAEREKFGIPSGRRQDSQAQEDWPPSRKYDHAEDIRQRHLELAPVERGRHGIGECQQGSSKNITMNRMPCLKPC